MDEKAYERFKNKILKLPSGCWIWMGGLQGKYYKRENGGYGSFRLNGRIRPAHIESWIHENGPIPEGKQIDHLCRITLCVNPDHLEPVTGKINYERGIGNKGEHHLAKTHCPSGHEYSDDNTIYLITRGRKHRACHKCRKETHRRSDAKRRNGGKS